LSSVSVTASTSIEPRSEGEAEAEGGTPLLSGIVVIWEVEEARMRGKRIEGKEMVGGEKWEGVWWWKVVEGGVKSWRWRRETDMVVENGEWRLENEVSEVFGLFELVCVVGGGDNEGNRKGNEVGRCGFDVIVTGLRKPRGVLQTCK
jgi:hypothetical protein